MKFNRGEMVKNREKNAHKLSRTTSSKICNPNIYKGAIKNSSSYADRQQDSTFIPSKNGGNPQQGTTGHQQINMGLPSQQTDHDYGRIPSQCSEHPSRLRVLQLQRQFRVETKHISFSEDYKSNGSTNLRSVCIKAMPPTASVSCMET